MYWQHLSPKRIALEPFDPPKPSPSRPRKTQVALAAVSNLGVFSSSLLTPLEAAPKRCLKLYKLGPRVF